MLLLITYVPAAEPGVREEVAGRHFTLVEGVADLLELRAELLHLVSDELLLHQASLEELRDPLHLRFLHADPGHLLDAEPDPRGVGGLVQGLEGKKVHVHDDAVVLQVARGRFSAAKVGHVDGHLVSSP